MKMFLHISDVNEIEATYAEELANKALFPISREQRQAHARAMAEAEIYTPSAIETYRQWREVE